MQRTLRILVVSASFLLFACVQNPVQQETVNEPGFFENRRYDYAMRLPLQLSVIEDSIDQQVVLAEDGTPVFQIAVERGGIPLQLESRTYDVFVEQGLMNACTSPISRCTGIASKKSFLTPAGLKGSEFVLTEEVQTIDGLETRTRGPFFVFNMTNTPDNGVIVLIVGAPSDIAPDRVNESLIRGTINTLRVGRIGPSEQGMRPAAEDEMCGGIAGIPCKNGLICRYDGQYPDAGGTCLAM